LEMYLSFSFGVGVQIAQSFSQWEARADTRRNVPNPADQRKLALTARNTLFAI